MSTTRRKLLMVLPAGAVLVTKEWKKPVVESVLLPAHAQMTEGVASPGLDTVSVADPRFELRFEGATTVDGVSLIITGGTECYLFGIRETADPNGWEELFHDATSTGVSLDSASSPGNVVLGSTTLFGSGTASGLTFIVRGCDSGNCWVWGHDPSTFAGEGCVVL